MSVSRIIGVVLVAVGVVLLIFAVTATDSPAEQLSQAFTGTYTEETMWYFILGIAAVVGGGLLALFGRGRG